MNGIGGRTIAEAQATLSFTEFMTWVKFRYKRGSLHTGMRVEVATARLIKVYAELKGVKGIELEGFAPHMDQPTGISMEEAMKSWR